MSQSDDLRRQIENFFPNGVPNGVRCQVCDTWLLPVIFTNGQKLTESDLHICVVCVLRVMPDAIGGWLA